MSTQTYALVFYGFPIEDSPEDLEERITENGMGRQLRVVTFGPFDEYSYALAIKRSYVEVNAESLSPLGIVPDQDYMQEEGWDKTLYVASEKLGLTFKQAHWYVAPWRF